MFLVSNPTRCHGNNRDLSSIESENNYSRNQAGVEKTECVSVLVEKHAHSPQGSNRSMQVNTKYSFSAKTTIALFIIFFVTAICYSVWTALGGEL